MSNVLVILFPNQLFEKKYIKKIFVDNKTDSKIKSKHILLWEHEYFFTHFLYHKMKLVLHRASMKNYYDLIPNEYEKKYVEYDENEEINSYIKKNKIDEIRFFNPIEKFMINYIDNFPIDNSIDKQMYPTPYFLNSTKFDINGEIFKTLGGLRHDLFYKSQRIRYNIMVKKVNNKYVPEGNSWSFDRENRKPFEKSQTEPPILKFNSKNRKEYLNEAISYVEKNFSKHYGIIDLSQFIYPINHSESIQWLEYFITYKLDNFGKYEDAFSSDIKFGFHSVLSPLTNIGLITPQDILEHVIGYKKNIASKEGFIRQVIGWREYCYFTYDLYGNNLLLTSIYKKNKYSIPKKIWENSTQIPPIDNILKNVTSNGYSHHIERLMGIGNFLILVEIDPQKIYNWFQTMYIDAYDVFMIPNVYGMLCYSKLDNKSHMMTRPYFSSSNYLIKMSNYKSSECVKINDITYKWDEIYDALYWTHVSKYSDIFAHIYATSSAVTKWEKFDEEKKKKYNELKKIYINWIHKK